MLPEFVSLVERVLEVAGYGFCVFPLWWPRDGGCACRRGRDCRNPGKHPRITNWQELATTDEVAIREWWGRWPLANIGILTGARSNLVVLDYDPGEEAVESLAVLEALHGELPATVQVLSGRVDPLTGRRGVHYYFRHPGTEIPNSVRTLAERLDLRGDGGLVVAPGSVHASGRRYEWEAGHHPADTPLADLPAGIVGAVRAPRTVHHEPEHWVEPSGLPPVAERIRRARAWLAQRQPAVQGQGGSSYTMGTCAVVVRGFALPDEESALEALADWNARCVPPWDERPGAPASESLRRKIRQGRQSPIVALGEKLVPLRQARVGSGSRPQAVLAPEADDSEDGDPDPDRDDRPAIVVAGDLELQAQAVLQAVAGHNDPPHLFQQARRLVRVVTVERELQVDDLDRESLRAHLGERFRVFEPRENKKTGETKFVLADMSLALAGYIQGRSGWDLPHLKSIVRSPCFAPGGRLIAGDGYDGTIEGFVDLGGLAIPEVPETPSGPDLARAKALILDELLGDFPFVDEASQAHAVALGLLPFVRPLIDGLTPLHMVTAPSEGVGKGKLVNAFAAIATGKSPIVMTAPRDDGEMEKKLTATLRLSPTVVLLDNVVALESAVLASALTVDPYTGRDLGLARMVTVPVRCAWTATANNPKLSREIARRTVWIRIDPKVEDPWLRTGFSHDPIEAWVSENRPDLAWAFLVLARNWIVRGCPLGTATLGSYERWSRVIGGILAAAEIPGFLANLKDTYRQGDSGSVEWAAFVETWWQRHGDRFVSVADLVALAEESDLLVELRGDKNGASQKIRLGRALRQRVDRVIAGYRIALGLDRHAEVNRYALVDVRAAPVEAPEPGTQDVTILTI
jgi:hypothetical protein